MASLWEQLETLRAIVDTARAEDLERQPEAIRTRYEPYAASYFVIEPVKQVEQRLVHELRGRRSVTGYLSADFGYGKTATAIYLWKCCLDSDLVAVPPFLFRRLKDLMQATKGWLAYQLHHTQPRLVARLEEACRAHAARSVEELAKEIAAQQGLSELKARAIVQEYIARQRDVTATPSLLDFLREATGLAQEAGFKGLVVFADETQEFVRAEEAGARDAVQTLSELVKGVRAMATTPLGLMLVMPVNPTETYVEDQAGDIMQRMRERGTALRLQDAYGREFPKRLWEHLCTSFGDERAKRAVEQRTLEALGQICERKDLSNGPRTVISAFKRIAQRHLESGCPYTPIDLMDDYLQGHIVFEGRGAKVTTTLRGLLELPSVQTNARRQQAVKLLAAFPAGVDQARAGEFYSVIDEDLAEKQGWRGVYIRRLPEGYVLIPLVLPDIPDSTRLDEIVRDFRHRWFNIWSEQKKAELAAAGFFREILPLLFPQRGQGQYTNFGGHANPGHDEHGVAYLVLEGCFERIFSSFPNRKICVSVSTDAHSLARFQPSQEDIDLDFRFFLEAPDDSDMDKTPVRIISANRDRRVDFHLNLKQTFGREFPPDLAFLRDVMSPERTSPQVLLGLSMRMWGWLEDHPDTSEADRQMIVAHRGALHRYALQLLLPDAGDHTKVTVHGIQVCGAEQRLVESAFEAKCAELYPNYKPLMVTKEWKGHLRRYRDALVKRPLAERRGREPFAASKNEIAKAFGWTHTVFESNSRTLQDMGLLKVHWGKGRGEESEARVLFMEHPLEELLRETLQREGRDKTLLVGGQSKRVKSIEIGRLEGLARRQGYLPEEVNEALQLLVLRQHVQGESDGTVHEFTGAVDPEELKHQATVLGERLCNLATHFREELRDHGRMLLEAGEYLSTPEDEVALDAAQRKLHELAVRLDEFIKSKARELSNRLSGLAGELERRSGELAPRELEQQVTGSVEFVRHVDDQRKALQRRFGTLRQRWDQLRDRADQLQQHVLGATDERALAQVVEEQGKLDGTRERLEDELNDLRRYVTDLQRWREVVTKASVLRDRLDAESLVRKRIDEDVTTSIMENFAIRQLEALRDWERFKADVDAIEAEINAEDSRRRNEFHHHKEQYEKALRTLTTQPVVQAIFDPRDPEQSYQVLYQGVLRKLQERLNEQRDIAQRVLNEFDYLIGERGIKADNERHLAEQVRRDLAAAAERLNVELVKHWTEFQRYCGDLEKTCEHLRTVLEELAKKRAQKEEPAVEERPVLEVLTLQRCSLENLRRQLASSKLSLDELFGLLKTLYRKGHIELEVRRRE